MGLRLDGERADRQSTSRRAQLEKPSAGVRPARAASRSRHRVKGEHEMSLPEKRSGLALLAALGAATLLVAGGQAKAPNPVRLQQQPPGQQTTVVGRQGEPGSRVSSLHCDPGRPVVDWNQLLLTIVNVPSAQPANIQPTRSFAILHAAIYDAVNAIDRTHEPYLVSVRARGRASGTAAA